MATLRSAALQVLADAAEPLSPVEITQRAQERGDQEEVETTLRMAHTLAVWFIRTYGGSQMLQAHAFQTWGVITLSFLIPEFTVGMPF